MAQHSNLLERNSYLGYNADKLHRLTISGELPEEANKEVTAALCLINKAIIRLSNASRILIEADAAALKLED